MARRSWAEVRAAVELIPKRYHPGGRLDLDQSLFTNDFTIRYLNGESKREAVDNATAMARIWNTSFDPELAFAACTLSGSSGHAKVERRHQQSLRAGRDARRRGI